MDKKFKRDFLKGSAATSFGTVVSMVFHFGSIMLLTRLLSTEDFGTYILIIVTSILFNLFAGLGLEITLTKFISSDKKESKGEIIFTVLISRAVALVVILIVYYLVGELIIRTIDERIVDYFHFIPILIVIINFRGLFYNLMQGLGLFKKYASVQIVSAVIRVMLIIAAIGLDILHLYNLVLIEIFSTFCALLLQIFVIPFKSFFKFTTNTKTFISLIKFTIPLYLNNLFAFIIDRANLFIIGIYFTTESVAYYDVANKVPEALNKIFTSFIIVYFPNISKLLSNERIDDAKTLMNKSLSIISVMLSFAVLISFLFRYEIIGIIFSDKYMLTSFAFALLILNFYLRALSNILGYSLVAAGFPITSFKTNIISSIVSITGSIIMIPMFGFIGAVYALLIMNSVSQLIYIIFLKKYLFLPDYKEYLKPLILILVTISSYTLIGNEFLFVRFLFIITYLLVAWMFIAEFRNLIGNSYKFLRSKIVN